MLTTLGRLLVKRKLPLNFRSKVDRPLDKKYLGKLMTELAKEDPDAYIDILQDLNNIGQAVVSTYGRDAALSYGSLKVSAEIKNIKEKLKMLVNNVLNDDSLSSLQKLLKIKQIGFKYTQKIQDAVFEDNDRRHTALASQINSGSRGNKTQLMQLQFGNMMMVDALNRDIPYIMMDSFVSGASPMGYWVSASSGRKGMYDVQAATGQAGYLGKQVSAATHNTVIEKEDCGTTDTGMPFPADSDKNIGAILLRPFHKHPAGSIVDEDMVAEAELGEEMILRSPTTCKCKYGICAKCNGLAENGKFPDIGEYVPLNAARSFVLKVTQSGISSKHVGGVGGKKIVDPDGEDQPTGFRGLERMFLAQKNFPGGAVLTPVDGTVSSIVPAAQGGHYINIGQLKIYASPYRTVAVKPGEKVYAGDVLTNGVPNPIEVVQYKGLGLGRRYFTNKLNLVLKKTNAPTDRRNVLAFTRSMISKVKITNPDGYRSWLPGLIVDYNLIMADYKPREDSVTEPVDKALNKYLLKPVLYYSIGTRITPLVASTLKKYKFDSVTASPSKPDFEAQFLRPAQVLQNDRNWLPRLAGLRLYAALFDAAQKGITDLYESTSYVDKIIVEPYAPNR